MADTQVIDGSIVFAGGITTDAVGNNRTWEDMENLLPPPGGGQGFRPRDGIEHVIALTSATSTGCEVFLVTLDDNTRTQLVAFRNASDGEIIHIAEFTEQYGRKPLSPYAGGKDPDDPTGLGDGDFGDDTPDPPSVAYMYIDSVDWADRGQTTVVNLLGEGPVDSQIDAYYFVINLTDGTIATDLDAPNGTCSVFWDDDAGQLVGSIELVFDIGPGEKEYAVVLYDANADMGYLGGNFNGGIVGVP